MKSNEMKWNKKENSLPPLRLKEHACLPLLTSINLISTLALSPINNRCYYIAPFPAHTHTPLHSSFPAYIIRTGNVDAEA
jgi:hypothetical protein